jgi:TPR repeat protein
VALMTLAGFYFFDLKSEDRYPEALIMLKKAEAGGEANASFISALIYLNGIGVEKDAGQARAYFERAGERGHTWGMLALYLLAVDDSAREAWKRRYEETYRRFHGRAADFEAGLKRFKAEERIREYVIGPLGG